MSEYTGKFQNRVIAAQLVETEPGLWTQHSSKLSAVGHQAMMVLGTSTEIAGFGAGLTTTVVAPKLIAGAVAATGAAGIVATVLTLGAALSGAALICYAGYRVYAHHRNELDNLQANISRPNKGLKL